MALIGQTHLHHHLSPTLSLSPSCVLLTSGPLVPTHQQRVRRVPPWPNHVSMSGRSHALTHTVSLLGHLGSREISHALDCVVRHVAGHGRWPTATCPSLNDAHTFLR